jgi:hypothetical protein
LAADPTLESLFIISHLALNLCHTHNLSSLNIAWLFFISVYPATENLLAPPKGEQNLFSNIGFIILKRTGFATRFQSSNL